MGEMARSVLIVDDDPGFRSLAARILRRHGLTVVGQATDVGEGARAARSLRPDAALVDVGLPDGDGIALATELSRLPWSPRVVVVSSDAQFARADRPGPDGTQLPFVAKEDLPDFPLHELFGSAAE
jgi:DNA-binding NarL/FixJ family response regulator